MQKKSVQAEYKSLSKDLSEKEQQLDLINKYIEKNQIEAIYLHGKPHDKNER